MEEDTDQVYNIQGQHRVSRVTQDRLAASVIIYVSLLEPSLKSDPN